MDKPKEYVIWNGRKIPVVGTVDGNGRVQLDEGWPDAKKKPPDQSPANPSTSDTKDGQDS